MIFGLLDSIQAKWSALHTLGLSGQIPFMDELLVNGMHIDMADKVVIYFLSSKI